jgi:hypothetical protein
MKPLQLSKELSLPIDAVTQTFAFLGRRGSGKTYGAGKLAELMLDAGAQIVVLDPIGVWYGLRLSADGKHKGFSVPVFGGEQGDVPLEPQAGALIAKLLVEERFSAVLDVSTFRKEQRKQFVTDFAEELMHRKKTNRSAIHVFFEESQLFVPQMVGAKDARMVGAFEDLIKLGRNYGIGASLISQRPQSVNKDVLNQTECLLAFQMTGPQERKTIDGWISDKGINENIADVLPGLGIGDARLWSPQWLQISKTIHIAKKTTFDASSTPTVGAAIVQPKELSPVDVEKIKVSMADVVKRADENDPKKLKLELVKAKRELEQAQKAIPQAVAAVATKETIKEVPVVPTEAIDSLRETIDQFRQEYIAQLERISQGFEALNGQKTLAQIETSVNKLMAGIKVPVSPVRSVPTIPGKSFAPAPVRAAVPLEGGEATLTKAERQILKGLFWTKDDSNVSPAKVGFYSDYRAGTGSFNNALSSLRSKGLLMGWKITPEGEALASTYAEAKPVGAELRQWLGPKLDKCSNEILDVLIEAYPHRLFPEQIAEKTASGYKAGTGSFNNGLARLRSLEAAEGYGREGVKASDVFFE